MTVTTFELMPGKYFFDLLVLIQNSLRGIQYNFPARFLLSLIGIILRWGFLIWELIFYLVQTFCPHLGSFCVVSSFTTFRPNFTSGLLLVILPWPQIGMLSLVTVITGDTVTRLSIPIRGRSKITWWRPEVKFGRNVVKEETTQKLTRWGQKVRNK